MTSLLGCLYLTIIIDITILHLFSLSLLSIVYLQCIIYHHHLLLISNKAYLIQSPRQLHFLLLYSWKFYLSSPVLCCTFSFLHYPPTLPLSSLSYSISIIFSLSYNFYYMCSISLETSLTLYSIVRRAAPAFYKVSLCHRYSNHSLCWALEDIWF